MTAAHDPAECAGLAVCLRGLAHSVRSAKDRLDVLSAADQLEAACAEVYRLTVLLKDEEQACDRKDAYLDEARAERDSLRQEVAKLKALAAPWLPEEVVQLTASLLSAEALSESRRKALARELEENQPAMADLIAKLETERDSLRAEIDALKRANGALVADAKTHARLKDAADVCCLAAEQERDSLRAEVARIPDLKAAIRYEIEKRDRFEAERDSLRQQLESTGTTLYAVSNERDRLKGEVSVLRQQLEAALAALRWARTRLLDVRNTSMVRLAVANILAGLDEAIESQAILDTKRVADERDSLKARVTELEAETKLQDERWAGTLDGTFAVGDGTAQREIDRLRARVAELEAERDSVRRISGAAPHDATVDAVRSLMDSRDRMETDRATLRRRVAELEDHVVRSVTEMHQRDKRIEEQNSFIARMQASGVRRTAEHRECDEKLLTAHAAIRAILPVYRAAAVYVGPARSGGPFETWNDLIYALSTARAAITPEIAAVLAEMETK